MANRYGLWSASRIAGEVQIFKHFRSNAEFLSFVQFFLKVAAPLPRFGILDPPLPPRNIWGKSQDFKILINLIWKRLIIK